MKYKGYSSLAVLLVAFCVLVISAVGYFVWRNTNGTSSTQTISQSQQNLITTLATSTSASPDIPGWKLYRDSRLGFQIEYPSDLIFSSGSDRVPGVPDFYISTIDLARAESEPGPAEFRGLYSIQILPTECLSSDYWITGTSTVSINSIQMHSYTGAVPELYTFAGDPTKGWSATCNTILIEPYGGNVDKQQHSIYTKILSTFKFLR